MPISEAAAPLREFWRTLQTEEPPFPVLYYVLGDAYRGAQAQEQAKADGKSAAGWLESPHNYKPARAIDVYPIVPTDRGPEVSNDPRDYRQVEELAASMFLISGCSFNDCPHVELPNWKGYTPKKKAPSPCWLAPSSLWH
jgi:hypothetical protein